MSEVRETTAIAHAVVARSEISASSDDRSQILLAVEVLSLDFQRTNQLKLGDILTCYLLYQK